MVFSCVTQKHSKYIYDKYLVPDAVSRRALAGPSLGYEAIAQSGEFVERTGSKYEKQL